MRSIVAVALSSTLLLQASTPLAAAPRGAQQPTTTGVINGAARTASGQALPGYTVQLRNVDTGMVVSRTTSSAGGNFTFSSLTPANYVVELVNPTGAVAGSSAAIAVTTGATVATTAALSTTTAAAAAVAGGAATSAAVNTALIVTAIAAAAGIAGVVVVARNDASPAR